MALGRFSFSGTTIDTSSDPDDTTLVAAPGRGQRIYLKWISVAVTTSASSTDLILEDGVGGSVLLKFDGAAEGTQKEHFSGDGLRLTANTLLNLTNQGATGAVATASGEVVVRGGVP